MNLIFLFFIESKILAPPRKTCYASNVVSEVNIKIKKMKTSNVLLSLFWVVALEYCSYLFYRLYKGERETNYSYPKKSVEGRLLNLLIPSCFFIIKRKKKKNSTKALIAQHTPSSVAASCPDWVGSHPSCASCLAACQNQSSA